MPGLREREMDVERDRDGGRVGERSEKTMFSLFLFPVWAVGAETVRVVADS